MSFMKFGGQTSKNVQDVRKLTLETCMCVSWWCLACLDVLLAIILCKTDVEFTWTVNVHIYVGNVRVRISKGPTKGPRRRTQWLLRHRLGSVNQLNQTTSRWWIDYHDRGEPPRSTMVYLIYQRSYTSPYLSFIAST